MNSKVCFSEGDNSSKVALSLDKSLYATFINGLWKHSGTVEWHLSLVVLINLASFFIKLSPHCLHLPSANFN